MYLVTASYHNFDDYNSWVVALYKSEDLAEAHATNARAYNDLALEESKKLENDRKSVDDFWESFENPYDLKCQERNSIIEYWVEEIEVED